jgi:hypothetical protein
MIVIYSRNQVPIRLTQERWEHILRRHPEMANQKDRVLETLSDPDLIQQGDLDTLLAIRFLCQIASDAKSTWWSSIKELNKDRRVRIDGLLHFCAIQKESERMEALKILESKPQLNWEYDEEADVLYISVGKPADRRWGVGHRRRGYRPLGREEEGDSRAYDHRAAGAPGRRHHPSAMSLSLDKA